MAMDSFRPYFVFPSVARWRRRVDLAALVAVIGASSPAIAAQSPNSFQSAYEFREAQAFMAKKEWADAVIALRKVLREDPELSPASVELSKALTYSGRREEALSVLTQAANRERAARKSADLLRRARVLSRQFLTTATFQLYQEGLSLMGARKYRQARDRFDKGLAVEPDNVEILTRLGQCQLLESDPDSAAERLRLAKKLNPFEPQIRLWLGRALHQRGELASAIEELRFAQVELQSSELAPVWFAEALTSASQRPAAIRMLEKNARERPFQLLSLLTLARMKFAESGADTARLWGVRKDLQVALSRMEQYGAAASGLEGDLGVDLRGVEQVRVDIEGLLKKVDARIEDVPAAPRDAVGGKG